MTCGDCGRFSRDPVCEYCLTGVGEAKGVKKPRHMALVVKARVEREGVFCACGAEMVARVGTWIVTIESVFSSRKPFPRASEERIIWHGCEVCGAVTRETLIPASL